MKISSKLVLAVLTLGALALATPALADSHGKADPSGKAAQDKPAQGKAWGTDPSPEDRAKMADAHQRMAECLRSSRPMKECRDEMMKNAHSGLGRGQACMHGESCPHGQDCPHGDACDGSCKHHGHHGGMSEQKGQGAPQADAETSEAATPKGKPDTKTKPKTN